MRLSNNKSFSPKLQYHYQVKIFAMVFGIFFGIFAMVFGEFDDSPGLQGLGMLLIIFILFRVYNNYQKSRG